MSYILRRNTVDASFSTIQTPSGTSPVATGADILTLLAGAGITITGDASTDSITFAIAGGAPWSLLGNAGTSAGTNFLGTTDSQALVVKTNSTEAYRVTYDQLIGVGITSPEVKLHVAGASVSTPAPTNFSVSQVAEQSNTASSGSGSAIYGPDPSDNAATVNVTQNDGSGDYFSDGSYNINYYVYAVIVIGSDYYYRGTAATANFTDTSSSNNFYVNVAWTAVSGADGYVVLASGTGNTGSTNFSVFVGNVTSWDDTGSNAANDAVIDFDTVAFPYDAGATPPSAITGSANMSAINVGSGYNQATGFTWYYEFDSAVQINGIWYVSGSPITVSAADANDSQFFDWYVDNYTLNGGTETDILVRRSTDGSSWIYFFVGLNASFTDGGGVNDSVAEAAWGRTYSTPTTFTHYYRIYGYGLSPTNSTQWFSSSYNSYTIVANNFSNGYVLYHSFTHGSRGSARLLGTTVGNVESYTSYKDTSATSLIQFYSPSMWTVGNTVTPTHYGYTNSTRYWRIYSQKTTPSTYYSSSYLQGSSILPNDGNYYTFNISWTAGVGSANSKILESSDGSTYSVGRLTGATSIVREATAPSFSDGTTVTPNSIDGQAIIGQNSASSSTSSGQIVARTTTASTGYSIIELQKSDGTVMNRWYSTASDSNGNFFTLGTKFSFHNNSAGNYADIGLTGTAFNKTNQGAGSYDFTINASSSSNGFKFTPGSGGQPKIYIGTTTADYGGALQIVNNGNVFNLYLRAAGSQTSDLIQAVNAASSYLFRVSVSGKVSIGNPSTTTTWLNLNAGSTSVAPIKFHSGSLLNTAEAGALEYLTEDFYMTHTASRRHPIASDNNPIGSQVFS